MPYEISESKRDWYRQVSQRSRLRKQAAARGELSSCRTMPNRPVLRPETLMPERKQSGLTALSLFCGGGGLDLGFERAGLNMWPVSMCLTYVAPHCRATDHSGQFFPVPRGMSAKWIGLCMRTLLMCFMAARPVSHFRWLASKMARLMTVTCGQRSRAPCSAFGRRHLSLRTCRVC